MDILEEKVTQLGGYEANLTCDVDSNVKEHFEYKYQDPLSINVSKHSWDVKGITLDTTLELTNSAIPFAGFIVKQIGRLLKSKFHRTNPNVILVSGMRDKVKDLL